MQRPPRLGSTGRIYETKRGLCAWSIMSKGKVAGNELGDVGKGGVTLGHYKVLNFPGDESR